MKDSDSPTVGRTALEGPRAFPSRRQRVKGGARGAGGADVRGRDKVNRVRMVLYFLCPCGVETEVTDFGPEMRVTPGYTNENGTSWPGEIELICPACKSVDDRTV